MKRNASKNLSTSRKAADNSGVDLYHILEKRLTVTVNGCWVDGGGLLGFGLLLQELERSDLSETRGSDRAN